MTLEEFQEKFKKNKRFDKFWYHGLCFATIFFSIFMLFSITTDTFLKIVGNKTFHFLAFVFSLLLGIYGLYMLRKTCKLSYWENTLTKQQNIELLNLTCSVLLKKTINLAENSRYFIYKKNWWRMPYEVHLFADENLIAINVEGLDLHDGGFIDFGASKRTKERILNIMKEKASH